MTHLTAPEASNETTVKQAEPSLTPSQRRSIILLSIMGLVILAGLVAFAYFLATTDIENTSRIRDIFIIFMALESLVIGAALIVLIIQLATLINLFQNEIKPILESTNEAVDTLRGTTRFISNNLVEPILKLNEYLAGVKRLLDLIRPAKK